MKTKLFFLLLLMSCTLSLYAQKKDKANAWMKSGSVLTYHLLNVTKEYDFIMSELVLEEDISFKWVMTEPVNYQGNVTIVGAAMDTASEVVNYFKNFSQLKLVNKTTVWVSRKLFKKLKEKGEAVIIIDKEPEKIMFKRNGTYSVMLDGTAVELNALVCETDKQNVFIVLDDEKYPLVLKMEISFLIELKSIETLKK